MSSSISTGSHAQDRATVVTRVILHIVVTALRPWFAGEPVCLAGVRTEIETVLRDEFSDIQRMTRDEIRESE